MRYKTKTIKAIKPPPPNISRPANMVAIIINNPPTFGFGFARIPPINPESPAMTDIAMMAFPIPEPEFDDFSNASTKAPQAAPQMAAGIFSTVPIIPRINGTSDVPF